MKEFLQELGLLLYKYDGKIFVEEDNLAVSIENGNKTELMRWYDISSEYIQELLREWED